MRIVFLSYLHGFGGAEKQNVMLANAMAKRGHDVTLVSICSDNNCYELDKKVNYKFIPDRKTNALRIITRYQDIKKTLGKLKPDITVNFWFQSAYMTALMNKSITGKIIYSERGDPGDIEYSGLLGMVRKVVLPRIDGFVFQSRGAQSFFDDKVKQRSVIIPNPVFVGCEEFKNLKERRKAVVTVGRFHPQKNHKLLIDAFALVANQISDYTLEIYGDGDLKDELQDHINSLGLKNRVFLKGTSKRIFELIYDSSLFVLSSDYEGLPNTLLEARALGIPVVSTDCKPGGAREIIEDGKDGFITPVGDAEKLSKAITDVLSDINLARKFSRIGIERMKSYNPLLIYDKWESFFRNIVI